MSITLKKLCYDTELKYGLKLVAGKNGMLNPVRWVHMVEDRQVPEFLHGNELIFTTGIGHVSQNSLLEFVKRLKSHNAVGVVINLGPYISHIPDDLIEYCNKENFPIFTLPWDIYIIDITYDFCRRIIENEELELNANECFKNIIKNPSDYRKYISFLEKQGFSKIVPYRILTLKFFKDKKNITESIESKNHIKLWNILAKSNTYPSAMFVLKNRLIVIRQDLSDNEINKISQMLDAISEYSHMFYAMGVSTEKSGHFSISELLDESDAAYAKARLEDKSLFYYDNMGIDKIIFGVVNQEILKSYVYEKLSDIIDYDKIYNTNYKEMLYTYLKHDCSVMAVADELGVHRNTINAKIKNIKSIFDIDLDGKTKMELLLAFKIKENLDKINKINGGSKDE